LAANANNWSAMREDFIKIAESAYLI